MIHHDFCSGSTFEKKRTLAGKFAFGISALAVLLITVAFCTPYWLESDRRIGPSLRNWGFGHIASGHFLTRLISNCADSSLAVAGSLIPLLWAILKSGAIWYHFFFTMCFINLLIACVLVPIYLFCFGPDRQYYVLLIKVIGIELLFSALLGTIAVVVFGAMGDSRAWMPDWQNNYLSWSFAFAVIGVFAEYVAGVLFFVESRIQRRKRKMRESCSGQMMETQYQQHPTVSAAATAL